VARSPDCLRESQSCDTEPQEKPVKYIPVDTSKLTIHTIGAVAPVLSPDGQPKKDRAGRPLFSVPVLVVGDGATGETVTVKVPGPVAQLAPMTPVRLSNLVARAWAFEGRSGVSLTAETIAPVAVK
jgi:hypothetical protein